VVVSSRKQDLCDQVASEIHLATGRPTLARAVHVGRPDELGPFVEAVVGHFGRIDVLVNNAGINPGAPSLVAMELEYWRKVFSVNVEGPLGVAQLVAPVMRQGGGGSIINVASTGAYHAGPNMAAYAASKAALVSLTRSMATEWAPWGIRVNAVSPGTIKSELTDGAERSAPGFYRRAAAATMLDRAAETAEIVGPVVYLASDASSYVTGDDILVSGGLLR
jgi:gluconate 5-dehydrogenase